MSIGQRAPVLAAGALARSAGGTTLRIRPTSVKPPVRSGGAAAFTGAAAPCDPRPPPLQCAGRDRSRGVSSVEWGESFGRVVAAARHLVLVLLACWVVVVAALVLLERYLIYFPAKALDGAPADYGLDAEELALRAADSTRLHGWWIRGRSTRALLWYHGNAGNISHRLDNARLLVEHFGLSILLADYRGYGRSVGSPDEAGLYLDGLAIYDAAAARGYAAEQLVVFGRSLGAAVAIEVARTRPVGAVILESPFRSAPALARSVYPFVPSFLVRTQFDNEGKIGAITAPILVLHGDRDEIVPIAHGQTLFSLATAPKRFFTIHGATHNDTYVVGGQPYLDAWHDFLSLTAPGADGTGPSDVS